ncbi:AraC family transcriptional regulator [Acinetobacter pittii]|uniref:AraC family transcriptional regulator n=1 Tax=Acinetobacter pittii TaxID=48296 RepID=UPI00300AD9AE
MPFELKFNTDEIDEKYRSEYVGNIFAPIVKLSPVSAENVFMGAYIRRVQGVVLVNINADPYYYERPDNLIWQSKLNMYLLVVSLDGGYLHYDDDEEILNSGDGDIVLVDLAKKAKGVANKGRYLQFYIPKDLLEYQMDGYKLQKNILLESNKPMTKILKDYMLGLFDVALRLQEKEASVTLYAFLSLLVVAIKSIAPQKLIYLNEYARGGEVLRLRVIDFIELNIKKPELNVELLMKTFRVSRAHLYRAFEKEGGVISVIRNKRLDMAYHELLNPINSTTVTQIAYEYGFSSSNQFSRAFRQRYGFGPNEIKRDQGKFNQYLSAKNDLYNHFKLSIKNINK